jgi:acyl dehydratase
MTASAISQPYFEDVQVDDRLPEREFGPLCIEDTVRWAGLQENWQRLHFDRDDVRARNGLRTFISSGAYRQALLQRMLTDWCGPRGMLRRLTIRHTYSTFEGDLMRYSAKVVEKSPNPADPWVRCAFESHNQDGRQILIGECVLQLPVRDTPR